MTKASTLVYDELSSRVEVPIRKYGIYLQWCMGSIIYFDRTGFFARLKLTAIVMNIEFLL